MQIKINRGYVRFLGGLNLRLSDLKVQIQVVLGILFHDYYIDQALSVNVVVLCVQIYAVRVLIINWEPKRRPPRRNL